MTNHSNPITDILKEVQSYIDDDEIQAKARAEALQALYEAVAPIIGEDEQSLSDVSYDDELGELAMRCRNKLRAEQRQKLRVLFEVDLGASEKPQGGNKPSGKQVDTRTEQLIPQSEIDAELEASAETERKFRDGELR